MDIQKLRIGNLAKDVDGNLCLVARVDALNAYFNYHDANLPGLPVGAGPIILTLDWVLKFGFAKKNKATYIKEGYVYRERLNVIWCVHHLQNDYFFKTGNELVLPENL